ncbi:Hypothetical protein HVR_LOCUS343 [uncultured virus]|nr:Hypothetical protein HVR_LOCUS343 [uncultured virus]
MPKVDKALVKACREGDEYLADYILTYEHDGYLYSYSQQPKFCSKYGNKMLDIVQSKTVDHRAYNGLPLTLACENGFIEIVELLISKYNKSYDDITEEGRPIEAAARNGRLEIVQLLLDHGTNILQYGHNAIEKACQNKHTDIAELIMKHIIQKCIDKTLKTYWPSEVLTIIKENVNVDGIIEQWQNDQEQ